MTERLYYHDSFLKDFDARVVRVEDSRVVLDRTAFYPTSGGQPFDTGMLAGVRVVDVSEDENGDVVHTLEAPPAAEPGATVHGEIDWERRSDHIQQHTGQHLLSAVFVKLFDFPTVSFHLGAETSTIDITAAALTPEQARQAEDACNQIIFEDRALHVFFATQEQARDLPLRKEVTREGRLRLVEIPDVDLSACGGTHVTSTGQIGCVLLRKIEKVKQGVRVEFVCGRRGVRAARKDFETLAEAAGVLTTHPHQLAAMVRRQAEDAKNSDKERQKLLITLAGYEAREMYAAAAEQNGMRTLVKTFDNGDIQYVRSLASQFAAQPNARALFVLKQPPTVLLAQSKGLAGDLGALVKSLAAEFGLRGGGSRDMAQAGAPDANTAERALQRVLLELSK